MLTNHLWTNKYFLLTLVHLYLKHLLTNQMDLSISFRFKNKPKTEIIIKCIHVEWFWKNLLAHCPQYQRHLDYSRSHVLPTPIQLEIVWSSKITWIGRMRKNSKWFRITWYTINNCVKEWKQTIGLEVASVCFIQEKKIIINIRAIFLNNILFLWMLRIFTEHRLCFPWNVEWQNLLTNSHVFIMINSMNIMVLTWETYSELCLMFMLF